MIRFLLFLLVLVIAVWLGVQIKANPGFFMLSYGHWTLQMPLWLAAISAVVLFLVLHWLLKLLASSAALPDRIRFWSGRRRARIAHQKTNRGLIALAEGNWLAAEKHLLHAAATADTPLINYLAAARAAQARGAYDRRDSYLRRAHAANPDAEIAIGLTQAQLQLDHRQLEQALATLRHLREIVPHHKHVLKMLQQLYCQLHDWQSLQELLPQLRKYRVLSPEELNLLSLKVYRERLVSANKEKQDATKIWQSLPRYLHHHPDMVSSYVPYLLAKKEYSAAEILIRETLRKSFNEKLLLQYAEIPDVDHKKQLLYAEGWLKHHKNDPTLLYVLGRLCLANQLWGKARSYFVTSVNIKPSIAALQELAQLSERLGETRFAMDCYRKAVVLSHQ